MNCRDKIVAAVFLRNNGADSAPTMNATARILLAIVALAALSVSAFAKEHKKKGTAIRVTWKDVPAAVQTTIKSNAAGGKVVEVGKDTAGGVPFYYAEVRGTDRKWTKVYVTETGTLMKVEPDNARNNRKHKPLFGGSSLIGPAPVA
jgi:hypothetical protein